MYDISKMTLREKVGQMTGLAFKGTTYDGELKEEIETLQVGLVVYFKDNVVNTKQVYELNQEIYKHAKIPPFIALDQEGGMVARVTEGITQTPGAMPIKASNVKDAAYKTAYNMGCELKTLGFNFNFAPVGDINSNPLNPVINVRSYSDNPVIASDYALDAVKGYTDAHLMTSIKHFPGHGDTAVDSHLGLPVVNSSKERLNRVELVPFKEASKNNAPGIMISHIVASSYDTLPASLSKVVVTDLLRKELKYNGLVITDSLTMGAIWKNYTLEQIVLNGFNSGCDILLLCGERNINMYQDFIDTAVRLIEEKKIDERKLDEAIKRIFKYKQMFIDNVMNQKYEEISHLLLNKENVEYAQSIMDQAITMVKEENKVLPLLKKDKVLIVFPIIKVVTLVENSEGMLTSLADFMPFKCDVFYIDLNPTSEQQAILITKCDNYDKIVYCSYNACFNDNQASLINSLDQDKLCVVALRSPYDINVLNVKTYLTSYEASTQAFISLSKILTGQIRAKGILPVKLK